jgi:P27 family predicted phage terminase small subunit
MRRNSVTKKLDVISGDAMLADPTPTPPQLGEHGMKLWRRVVDQFDMSDPAGFEMLKQACEATDNLALYSEIIARDGPMIKTKTGPKEHPMVKHQMIARAFIVRTLSRLGLNFEPVRSAIGRPPKLYGEA